MDFKIEKKVPLPEYTVRRKYPFAEMKVGDSFSLPPEKYLSVYNSIAYFRRKHEERRFTVRKDDATGGFRCWRVE